MIKENVGDDEVTFVSCNTDAQALERCSNKAIRIQLGPKTTKGLGAGANPDKGEEAAKESIDTVLDTFSDAHMLFITAGAGGGTGGGGAHVIAQAARDKGILTIGFVTRPFLFEGRGRAKAAQKSIEKLQECVDCLIIVQNQNLLEMNNSALSVTDGFAMVDSVLCSGVAGIVNIISRHGVVNVDFQDALKVMKNRMSRVVFGVGTAEGDNAGSKAAAIALSNPLLELDDETLRKVDTALISVTGGAGLSLQAVEAAVEYLRGQINTEEDSLIVGMAVIPEMKEDAVEVCIFASCPKPQEEQTIDEKPKTTEKKAAFQDILRESQDFVTIADNNNSSKNLCDDKIIGKPHLNLQEEDLDESQYNISSIKRKTMPEIERKKPTETQNKSLLEKLVGKKKWWG